MSIFDRFRKSKQTAAPALASTTPPPAMPARATIASFVVEDAVGRLDLAGGGSLRFGRSACTGFEPVVGAAVIVEELASDVRGWKARTVTLDPEDTRYDALLAARDAERGLPGRIASAAEAAATARALGVVTVLLREPLPSGTPALAEWAAARGFPRDGFAVRTERDLEFVIPRGTILTYPGREPFPRADLDLRAVGDDLELGRAFIGLGVGLPGGERRARAARGGTVDGWAPEGTMRQLGRLVGLLAADATAVVLPRAGDLVVPIDDFMRMLGELDDPECRPFAAWLDVGITRSGETAMYATFGMDVFGLPDVLAAVDPDDRWSRSRRHEAVLYACYRMIRDRRELAPGETLEVPVRLTIGAWPIELDDGGAATTYTIAELDGNLELVVKDEVALGGELAVNLYQALFDRGLAELVPSQLVRDVRLQTHQPLAHHVEVRARKDGRGYLIVTNGFGHKAGLELGTWTNRDTFELVQVVGMLAAFALESPAGWKAGDTVAAPIAALGIAGFVLADGGTVAMGDASDVRLVLLVPLTEADHEQVRSGGAAAWLADHPPSETSWDPILAGRDASA